MPATAVLLLLHVPPETVLLKIETAPMHIAAFPVIGATVTTVIGIVLKQPVGSVYVMTAVPAVTGVTDPVVAFTTATPGDVVLLQLPPVVALLNATGTPTHVDEVPVIAGGSGTTVSVLVILQPIPMV